MKDKLKIIYDIIFKNIEYKKYVDDSNIKHTPLIKQENITPLILIGRSVVSKPESENIPEDIIYDRALKNILYSKDLITHCHKSKSCLMDNKIAYEVQITLIPKK